MGFELMFFQNKAKEIAEGLLIFAEYNHTIATFDDGIQVSCRDFGNLIWERDFSHEKKDKLENLGWIYDGIYWKFGRF